MIERKGEKIGWIGGWIGGFLWLLVMSIILLVKGNYNFGIAGLMLFGITLFLINIMSPWRQPEVKYWILFTPLYAVFIISLVMVVVAYGDYGSLGESGWSLLRFIPIFIPYIVIGQKTWDKKRISKVDG